MSARSGLTQERKRSERCLDNTARRRFLVIEQDTGTLDEQAAVLSHLAEIFPLVTIVHSGGRSLHGWFYVEGIPEARIDQFMDLAVRLGADDATRSPCQLVRLPDGIREMASASASNSWIPLL